MTLPTEMRSPGLWRPLRGKAIVLLPYRGTPSGNYHWLKEVLGPGSQVGRGEGSSWEVARSRAHEVLVAMQNEYGRGRSVLVFDVAEQVKCGPSCQEGNPENALTCECSCGGENHGGIQSNWVLRDSFAVRTDYKRFIYDV